MTSPFPQIATPPQTNAHVLVNEALDALKAGAVYARAYQTSSGLTWGYYGGRWGGFSIAAGTLTLTASDTNDIVVEIATGDISVGVGSDSLWDDPGYLRVYRLTTDGTGVTAEEDHRAGPGGVYGGGGGGGGGGGSTDAADINIVDTGSYFTGTDVEAALQEVGSALDGLSGGGTSSAIRKQAQPIQAALSLSADGVFRDLRSAGLGTLTVGTIATITDNSAYNAWPAKPTRLLDGRILLVYTTGTAHHSPNDGKAVGKIGTENLDGTVTWGSEFTIFDDASLWTSGYGATQISTGRVIVSLWRDDYATGGTGRAGYVYSDDACATWSALQDLHTPSGFTGESYCESECVELPNGDILIGVGGIDSGDTYLSDASFKILRSTDGGDTFGSPVAVSTASPVFESVTGLLSDGSLLCIHRIGSSSAVAHKMQRSTDGGQTWGSMTSMSVSGYGKPNFIQSSTGTLVLCTRGASAEVVLHTSTDLGATWSTATTVDATMNESEYGAPFQLRNGGLMVVYGSQPTSSTSDSDIKSALVTEDTVRIGTLDLAASAGILPVANGGSGTDTPSLVAGTGVTITGDWPNQTISASVGSTTTSAWNPSDKGATGVSLSVGNKIATFASTDDSVRGTQGQSAAGDFFFEVTILNATDANLMIGIGKSTAGLSTYVGADADGWAYYYTANRYNNNSGASYGATFAMGDVIGVRINAGVLSFYKNGVSQGTAYSGISGTVYPMAGSGTTGAGNRLVYLNTGGEAYTFPPAGVTSWG